MQNAKAKSPTLKEERKLWQQRYDFVVGLDEVGRGPLAGPVVACAVCVRRNSVIASPARAGRSNPVESSQNSGIAASSRQGGTPRNDRLKDSKKLSANQRAKWYEFLTTHEDIKWGIGLVSAKIIDQINILAATKLAMKRALDDLVKKGVQPEYLLLDGNFLLEGLSLSQKAVKRGDEKIWSCAAASVIAKVTRDRLMAKYHQKYQGYGFDRHKGYGTRAHFAALKQHGPCAIHRRTFAPFK
ncbi:ribonuclease HII [Patescibacteria group bacterium]|nr:ribonuclease HII [Patescibacteria group bacterium]